MYVSTSEIVQKANSIVAQCGTRDPLRIAKDLGIEVMYYPFNEQRGAYKVNITVQMYPCSEGTDTGSPAL